VGRLIRTCTVYMQDSEEVYREDYKVFPFWHESNLLNNASYLFITSWRDQMQSSLEPVEKRGSMRGKADKWRTARTRFHQALAEKD